jgi:hypothetical protein
VTTAQRTAARRATQPLRFRRSKARQHILEQLVELNQAEVGRGLKDRWKA